MDQKDPAQGLLARLLQDLFQFAQLVRPQAADRQKRR